jgi:hypothetical protein
MTYVVLLHGPTFDLEGTVHDVCSDPHPEGSVRTGCGRTLENTPETATQVLVKRPRGKRFTTCKSCVKAR